MKIARVFVQEYANYQVGDINDVFDVNYHPGQLLSGVLKEVPVADDFDHTVKKGIVAEDGSISFVDDEDKIQNKRNQKLATLRMLRDQKLKEVDLMVNDVSLNDSEYTAAQVKAYRQALKDFTVPYKYANDANKAKIAIDGLDLLNISWPTI